MDFVGVRYIPRIEVKTASIGDSVYYITPQHPDYKQFVDTVNVVACHGIELKSEVSGGWIVIHHFFPERNKMGRIYLRENECDQFYVYEDIPEDMLEQIRELKEGNGAVMAKIELPGLLK